MTAAMALLGAEAEREETAALVEELLGGGRVEEREEDGEEGPRKEEEEEEEAREEGKGTEEETMEEADASAEGGKGRLHYKLLIREIRPLAKLAWPVVVAFLLQTSLNMVRRRATLRRSKGMDELRNELRNEGADERGRQGSE